MYKTIKSLIIVLVLAVACRHEKNYTEDNTLKNLSNLNNKSYAPIFGDTLHLKTNYICNFLPKKEYPCMEIKGKVYTQNNKIFLVDAKQDTMILFDFDLYANFNYQNYYTQEESKWDGCNKMVSKYHELKLDTIYFIPTDIVYKFRFHNIQHSYYPRDYSRGDWFLELDDWVIYLSPYKGIYGMTLSYWSLDVDGIPIEKYLLIEGQVSKDVNKLEYCYDDFFDD
jgi:hypothetical protein